jgi:hypothetical protein
MIWKAKLIIDQHSYSEMFHDTGPEHMLRIDQAFTIVFYQIIDVLLV